MLITKIDEFLDNFLNNLYIFLNKNKIIDKFKNKENFVSLQNEILEVIKKYIDKIDSKELLSILKNKNHCNLLVDVIKKYTAYYIYLSIAYYYEHGKESFTTNLFETSEQQKNSKYVIANFFNSYSNIKILEYYLIIRNIKQLYKKFGTSIQNIYDLFKNNPENFRSVIIFFNELEEEYIINNILIDNNIHNILKVLIFRFIYLEEDKQNLLDLLDEEIVDNEEYTYIEIVEGKDNKTFDIALLNNILKSINKDVDAYELSDMLENFINNENNVLKSEDYTRYLLENKILIPITEDILRYNKNNKMDMQVNERNDTRIKIILRNIMKITQYSFNNNDKNMKIKGEQIIHKPLKHRNAILYNDVEELKVLNKLKNTNTKEYENDISTLEEVRKYNYINYKGLSKDGFRIRLHKPIECIRYTNILYNHSNKRIETRMTSESIYINIVGLAFNPNKLNLQNQKNSVLVNIQDSFKSKNNYENLKKVIDKKENKIYYWLFNNKNDFIDTDKYTNSNITPVKHIYSLLEDYYKHAYINYMFENFVTNINKYKSITLWQLDNLILYYDNLLDFKFSSINDNFKNNIINYILSNKLEKNKIKNCIELYNPLNKRNINKLPTVDVVKEEKNIIEINKQDKEIVTIDLDAICIHYKKLYDIKQKREFKIDLINYIQQYCRLEGNDYICKSCNDIVDLRNYTIEGTYNDELDTFVITTDPIKKMNLIELDKYNKYPRTYKEINKWFEKLVKDANIDRFIGATTFKNMERKYMIKDVIDLFNITKNYKHLKTIERKENAEKQFRINKSLTELFFFELDDDIFKIDANSIDKFKIIKQNNVLIYLILILILELNNDNIAKLSVNEYYNYVIFNHFKEKLFGNMFLQIDGKSKTKIINYPILCYLIYYMSSLLVYKNIWLNNDMKKLKLNDPQIISFQKIAIHTFVDLFNFIIHNATNNTNQELNKIYNIIKNRLETTLSNKQTLEKIIKKSNYYVKKDNKVVFKKYEAIPFIDNNKINEIKTLKPINAYSDKCIVKTLKLGSKQDNIIPGYNPIINCSKTLYHNYILEDNDLVCSECKEKYSDLLLKYKNKTDNYNEYKDIVKKMQKVKISNIMSKYCINGNYHEFDEDDSVCKKCNKDTKQCDFNDKDIHSFKKLFNDKLNNKYTNFINRTKKLTENIIKNNEMRNEYMSEFNEGYNNMTLKNITNAFISKLIDNSGYKLKSINNKKTLYIDRTRYIINHNHLGHHNKELIFINKEDNLVKLEKNNKFFNKDVYVYTYKNISTYYNATNYQYIGYKDKKDYVEKKNSDVYLIIDYSIKDKLLKFGLSYDYYSIKSINEKLYNKGITKDNINIVIKDLIRKRVNNLKNIINKIKSIIYKISNKNVLKSDDKFIKDYNNLIQNINIINKKNNKKLFSDSLKIINNIKVDEITKNEYINTEFINSSILKYFSNADTKILYYIVHNLNNILIFNQNNKNINEISNLIIEIINIEYNKYHIDINNSNYKLLNYVYDNNKEDTLNMFSKIELDTNEKSYDELLEEDAIKESINEEYNALDIDDYDTDEENDMYANEESVDNEIM